MSTGAGTDVLGPPAPQRPYAGRLPSPAPAGEVRELAFDVRALACLRHAIAGWAGEEILDSGSAEDLVLAVNELASNSVRHGGGRGTLRYWREAQALVCEVHDAGHIEDPYVGRTRPGPDAHSGRGLWLVDQLCDEMQIRSSRAGTVVRVLKRVP
ncbi:MAG TPA: ATP-binding protein [Solirubrobacteraceae bacterium]|nr:ATP-binding protein [Solirubrobacteraceae bacterium]